MTASVEDGGQPEPMEFAWLIERGQPERQIPTVWWSEERDSWEDDALKATRYRSKDAAERAIERSYFRSNPIEPATARAVEHGFVGGGQAVEPAAEEDS